MKKGRHRRFEEARALKRQSYFDPDSLLSELRDDRPEGSLSDEDDDLDDDDLDDDELDDDEYDDDER